MVFRQDGLVFLDNNQKGLLSSTAPSNCEFHKVMGSFLVFVEANTVSFELAHDNEPLLLLNTINLSSMTRSVLFLFIISFKPCCHVELQIVSSFSIFQHFKPHHPFAIILF